MMFDADTMLLRCRLFAIISMLSILPADADALIIIDISPFHFISMPLPLRFHAAAIYFIITLIRDDIDAFHDYAIAITPLLPLSFRYYFITPLFR
jgi:hypothetical protein